MDGTVKVEGTRVAFGGYLGPWAGEELAYCVSGFDVEFGGWLWLFFGGMMLVGGGVDISKLDT